MKKAYDDSISIVFFGLLLYTLFLFLFFILYISFICE